MAFELLNPLQDSIHHHHPTHQEFLLGEIRYYHHLKQLLH